MRRALAAMLPVLVLLGLGLWWAQGHAPGAAPAQAQAQEALSLPRIADRADFDRLARVDSAGKSMALPQVMFALDRSTAPPEVIWIDSRRFRFHVDFLQATYRTLSGVQAFVDANYSNHDRRFLLGSAVLYPRLDRFGVELWEGDVVEPALLGQALPALQAGFYAPLTFKPNSAQQQAAAQVAGLETIDASDAYGSRTQLVLNPGKATGRLVLAEDGAEDRLLPGDIALLRSLPIRLPPVAGILAASFSTPIAHVNLLAKSWGVPNAYAANADSRWAELAGQMVTLDTTGADIVLRPATAEEAAAAASARAARAVQLPAADSAYRGLPALEEQDSGWSRRTGAKAANLGTVAGMAREGGGSAFTVPPGFSVPFAYYDRFVAGNALQPQIDAAIGAGDAGRATALAALRAAFAAGTVPADDMATIRARRTALLGTGGVFVRSSTNAEDLPGFNGAGLYDTVPNVVDDAAFAAALKTVWGSLWNDRAFAARAAAGIDHRAVRAAVLVQSGVDADAAGVLTTVDPFAETDADTRVFIAAKRGLGIRVVEGRKIAEQLIYRAGLDSIQVLTRSEDDTVLQFDAAGGVRAVTVEPRRAVLTDALVRQLAAVGLAIQARFDNRPQDIEWLVKDGRVVIVQARDYIRGTATP